MFDLLSLPNDLVYPIIESIEDRADLIALAQTCSKLQPLAERQLFKSVYLRYGRRVETLASALRSVPERFEYVHELEVTPTTGSYTRNNGQGLAFEDVPALLANMSNLRVLKLESPFINTFNYDSSWIASHLSRYLELLKKANVLEDGDRPLKKLQKLVLHSHGDQSRYYPLKLILPIFLSPTLKHIHVSCVDFDNLAVENIELHDAAGKTPLQTLVLDECDVDADTLSAILSLPRNLASLSVQENLEHAWHSHRLNDNFAKFLSGLQQQAHSLQYLQHSCPDTSTSRDIREPNWDTSTTSGLSGFRTLRTVEVATGSNLRLLLQESSQAPPVLSTVRLTHLKHEEAETWETLPDTVHRIVSSTSFGHLELHMVPLQIVIDGLAPFFMHGWNLPAPRCIGIARAMRERNITTKVLSYRRGSCFPPYLYGEQRPVSQVIFDSKKFWALEEAYAKQLAEASDGGEEQVAADNQDMRPRGDGITRVKRNWKDAQGEDGTMLAAQLSAGWRFKRAPKVVVEGLF